MESVKTANPNKQISKWLSAIDRRRSLFPQMLDEMESLRLLHSETEDLRIDKVGEHLVGGWWRDQPPTEAEKNNVRQFIEGLGYKSWYYYWRPSKGVQVDVGLVEESDVPPPEKWVFKENNVSYEARRDQGHSYGLFLDQRHNRKLLKENAQGKKVLNLFCFTGGFSVCAAVGGAKKVVSVDLSKRYLDWSKTNFALNGCHPESESYEFRAMDSLDYLNYARKKALSFDFIVCDPPSFSRNGKKVFRIEKDYQALVEACADVLAPGGQLLFSTNFEKWGWEKWEESLNIAFSPYQGAKEAEVCYGERDFEAFSKNSNLKCFLLSKA